MMRNLQSLWEKETETETLHDDASTMLSCPFFILQEMSPATLRMQSSVGSHPKGPVTLFYCHSYDYCLTLDPIHRNEMKKSFHLDKLSADLSFFLLRDRAKMR